MEQESIILEKSPNDDRQYFATHLPNELKLVLISDPKAQKAACSISVGVGSLSDGERSLGLAHFLEHMLFMGSKKYPSHGEYAEFISLNSGSDNAYTSDEETNYYFEVANPKFKQGVMRISDFFLEALLTPTCVEKERQAVHEECMLRTGEDNSRKWEILKYFANGPYHNHSIGNNQTLGHPQVHQDLTNFYKTQYSANRINAVLLSAMSIEQMKQQMIPILLQIENKNLAKIDYDLHFLPSKLGKIVQMQSIKDECLMEYFWIIDSVRPHYQHHPEKYLTHVLGHQGQHSLLSILKSKDWASQISSYSHNMPRQTIVGLEIRLTQHGKQNYQQVYNLVIDYTSWLSASKDIYEELSQTSAISFKFREKGSNSDYVTTLSSKMHEIPLPELLSYGSKYAPFNKEIIDNFIKQLNPFNLIVVYSHSEQLKNPKIEKYLGGKFIYNDLPPRQVSGFVFSELKKNPFLPMNTQILPISNQLPVKKGNIWFSRSNFPLCKGGIALKVVKRQSDIFLEFYSKYLELLLKELTYDAESLKLSIDYNSDQYILEIKWFGFSHTVQRLIQELEKTFSKVHRSERGQKLFDLTHQTIEQEYDNFYEGEVDQIAEVILESVLIKSVASIEERQQELGQYDYASFCDRIDAFWKDAGFEWVIVGNFEEQPIFKLVKQFEHSINGGSSKQVVANQCIKLKQGSKTVFVRDLQSEDIGTSGVILYNQLGPYTNNLYYQLALLKTYIKQPYFDELRTQKQLAYYLRAYDQNYKGVLSLNFILISSNSNPFKVSNEIKGFIHEFLAKMQQDLTEEKLLTLKKSVKSNTLQPFQDLHHYFRVVCGQIERGTYSFQRKTNEKQLDSFLKDITRQDLINLLKKCINYALQIWIVAQPHHDQFEKLGVQCERDIQKIKSNSEFYDDHTITKAI